MPNTSIESRYQLDASTGPAFPIKEGQEVLVVDNRGRTLWNLENCLVSKGVIQSVKRSYVYVGRSMDDRFPVRFNRYTLIEARTDGYSARRALFESEESLDREREYNRIWEKVRNYFTGLPGHRRPNAPLSFDKLREIERLIDGGD